MKTLDEVIKAFEWCLNDANDDCDGCPYYSNRETDCHVRNVDALYYLKEYQGRKEALRHWNEKAISEQQNIADAYMLYKAALEKEKDNLPLTWDELKSMVGKPVWVEALLYKQWAVIAYVGDMYIRFEGANLYAPECRIYMGEDNGWQAYRKERA